MHIILKEFQNKAIEDLIDDVRHKWKKPIPQTIYFQSPTGSGKTIIMAELVRQLVGHPDFIDLNFAFLWVSIGGSKQGDLAQQSKNKFENYLNTSNEILISNLHSLGRKQKIE